MDNSDVRLEGVPEKLAEGGRALVERLVAVGGDRLRSCTVFGQALMTDHSFGRATLESVAVFSEVDLDMVHQLAIEGQQLGRYPVRAPLVMTPRYIEASCDAFAVELLEIQQVHTVVWGDECFSDLGFDRSDMRLQCERELKRALIHLRQGLLASGGKDHLLPELTSGVMEQTLRVLRGLLWLWDQSCSRSATEMVQAVEAAGKLELAGLSAGLGRPSGDPYARLVSVYADLEALTHCVNEMSV